MGGWNLSRMKIGMNSKAMINNVIRKFMKYLGKLWVSGQVVWDPCILVQGRARDQQADGSYISMNYCWCCLNVGSI